MLDCSAARLKHVPDRIPSGVRVIDLSHNKLKELQNDSFVNCVEVKKLVVSNNEISVIRNSMLRGMPNLEMFEMEHNFVYYTNWHFPDNTYDGIPNLKSLSMQLNAESGLHTSDFEFMMSKLPRTLEELNVDIPPYRFGEKWCKELIKFTQLRKLGVYQVADAIKFGNNTFKYLENISIEELTVRTSLSSIEPLAFYYLTKLKTLDIDMRRPGAGISLILFTPALIGLQSTKIEKIKLSFFGNNLWPKFKDGIILNDAFCRHLVLPYLIDLQMDHGGIYDISDEERGCFSKLANLRLLNISFNYISITKIDLLRRIGEISNSFELDVSHQIAITEYDDADVLWLSSRKILEKLDISFIMNSGNMPNRPIKIQFDSIKYLHCQGNFIRVLGSVEHGMYSSELPLEADFSHNNMISFAGAFDDAIKYSSLKVTTLVFSDNKLGRELSEDEGGRILQHLADLTKLDFSSNEIKSFPQSIFKGLARLQYLNLNKNSLLFIRFQISHMMNLQFLDLSDNLLSQLDTQFQSELETVKNHSPNFTVDMLGNPFQCSCDTRSFLNWIYQKRSMFSHYEEYTCVYQNNPFLFKNMSKLLDTLSYQCSLIMIVKVSAGLIAFLIVVIALSVFLYRHKWDVRFFCLRYVTNRKAYQEFEGSEEEYEYDAFVSFHSDDQDWVWNELHENLDRMGDIEVADDQSRFRLCIHERDFVPGDLIEENILRSIESSRKTIVVLSRNFLQSVWCEFELQIARKLCVEKGRDLIIAVMLEPLPTDIRISQSVERLVRKNTYIEWPTETLEQNHFWNQMRCALGK